MPALSVMYAGATDVDPWVAVEVGESTSWREVAMFVERTLSLPSAPVLVLASGEVLRADRTVGDDALRVGEVVWAVSSLRPQAVKQTATAPQTTDPAGAARWRLGWPGSCLLVGAIVGLIAHPPAWVGGAGIVLAVVMWSQAISWSLWFPDRVLLDLPTGTAAYDDCAAPPELALIRRQLADAARRASLLRMGAVGLWLSSTMLAVVHQVMTGAPHVVALVGLVVTSLATAGLSLPIVADWCRDRFTWRVRRSVELAHAAALTAVVPLAWWVGELSTEVRQLVG